MNAGRIALAAVASLAGLVIGLIDLGASEVVVPLGLILLASAVLGAASPRQAWLAALLVGVGLPLFHIGAALLGHDRIDTAKNYALMALVAQIPAFLGAGLGATLGWVLRTA